MTEPRQKATASRKAAKKPTRSRRRSAPRVRVLPVTILVATLILSMKVVGVWNGVTAAVVETANAAEAEASQATELAQATAPRSDDRANDGAGDRALEDGDVFKAPPQDRAGDGGGRVDLGALSRGEITVLQKLADRRREIEQREKALDEREQLVAAMEKRVDAKLAEMKQIQGRLEELAGQYSEREEREYKRLVKIYEAMEPKDAARIFEDLDPPVLLQVISRMKERKTAPILAEMDPKAARYVTTRLAERRQLPTLGD